MARSAHATTAASATAPSPTALPATAPSPTALPATAPSPTALPANAARAAGRYAFPILGGGVSYGHAHHDYPASDIFAPCGAAFVAVTAGRVSEVSRQDRWSARVNDGATRGGLSVALVGDDGVRYYGSHLSAVAPSVVPGARVGAGQRLGVVGHSGDAAGLACHVHFGISPPCGTGDWWVRRGVLFPWPYLDDWRRGRPGSPASAVAAWRTAHGCPSSFGALPQQG
jgi:murein DD-endopeptidase MepM/ murein hydrolase activator NlpD